MSERRKEAGRNATAMLASVFVIVGGLLTCVMIALAFASRPVVPLTACGIYLGTLILLIWLGRERPRTYGSGTSMLQYVRSPRSSDFVPLYRPRPRPGHRNEVFGTNEPPSAETVREINDNIRTWVPSDRNLKRVAITPKAETRLVRVKR